MYRKPQINEEEAEAGSILVALSNHNTAKKNTKSMSIHNLLDDANNNEPAPILPESRQLGESEGHLSNQEQRFLHQQHRYSYPNIRQNYRNEYMQEMSPESYYRNSIPQPPHHHQPATHPSQMSRGRNYASQPYPEKRQGFIPAVKSSHYNEYTKKYTNMKEKSKTRRNAIQAYICYMTYTDLVRKRVERRKSTQINNAATTTTTTTQRHSPIVLHQPTPPNQIVEQPLTAFLKRPNQSASTSFPRTKQHF